MDNSRNLRKTTSEGVCEYLNSKNHGGKFLKYNHHVALKYEDVKSGTCYI